MPHPPSRGTARPTSASKLGAAIVQDGDYNYQGITGTQDGDVSIDHKTGFDGDLIGGYDFGMIRAELELGYKKAKIDQTDLAPNIGAPLGEGGKARVRVGDGQRHARLRRRRRLERLCRRRSWPRQDQATTSMPTSIRRHQRHDGVLAWQVIAGVRKAISPNIDLGLKYRFFNTTKFNVEETDVEELSGKFDVALAAGEPDLQLRQLAAASASAASAAASAAASGDADLPGRLGDPGDGRLSAAAAAAAPAAASAGAGTGLSEAQ